MEKDTIPVTEQLDEVSLEELEERLELDCGTYTVNNSACCW